MANQWFYAKDGQKFGPVSGKRLKELATLGILRRNDLIWSPGYSVWRPAKKFRGLLPKMDATSLSPAMSLFWKATDEAGAGGDGAMQGMFPEPDSPATSITPPLPGAAAAKKSAAAKANSSGTTAAIRSAPKRPASASASVTATATAPAAARPAAPSQAKKPAPEPIVVEQPRANRGGISGKEKLLIGAGLFGMLVIYAVFMLRAMF